MPLISLKFKPGVNRDQTNYAGEGGWYACDKVRFLSGYPEKLGGWAKRTATQLVGSCRQMFNYITTFSDNFLCVGTSRKVYIEAGLEYYDVTPLRQTFTGLSNIFTTVIGETQVTVTITGHGASAGDFVTFSGVSADVGGISSATFNEEFEVVAVVSANEFTITSPAEATSSATGGGSGISAAFQINTGSATAAYGYAWGAGVWGRGTWGSDAAYPVVTFQRDWWFANFDNDLVMNIRDGAIYYWERGLLTDPSTALTTRAVLLSSLAGASDVPDQAMQILVSQNDKHLLAFGCTPYGGGVSDPLLIRWANQDDPTDWTPSPTTSAGFLRVSRGSRIIRAIATRQEVLIWTESTLSSLQFLGTTDVFGLQEMADNISIMSPRAMASVNNATYWMGKDKFYSYSGRVDTLPTTLRQHVFDNFNYDQAAQVVCGTNEGYNEIWWFYPSANAVENDSYVVYNHRENIWYYGSLDRTAWLDSPLQTYPLAYNNGYIYEHEKGVDADGTAMSSFIYASDVDIDEGEHFMLLRRVIPDINFSGSTANNPQVTLTIQPRNFPGQNYTTVANDSQNVIRTASSPVDQYTNQVFIRARARQISFEISSDTTGVQWQLGAPRIDARPDGRR